MIGLSSMCIINIDDRQVYYQISILKTDREKNSFFGPDHRKFTSKVITFGPKNVSPFSTFMMGDFKRDWEQVFIELPQKWMK